MRQGKCLELRYGRYSRIVEVHAVGTTAEGNLVMRVWQVRGGSGSNERVGWKMFALDQSFSPQIINEKSMAPRPGYKRGDTTMKGGIDCQV